MQLRRMRGVDVKRDEKDADGTTTRGAGARKERTARPVELLGGRSACVCGIGRRVPAWRGALPPPDPPPPRRQREGVRSTHSTKKER